MRSVETTPLSPVDRFLDKSVGKKCTVFFFVCRRVSLLLHKLMRKTCPSWRGSDTSAMTSLTSSSSTAASKIWPPSRQIASSLNLHVRSYRCISHSNLCLPIKSWALHLHRYLRLGYLFIGGRRLSIPHVLGRVGATFRTFTPFDADFL